MTEGRLTKVVTMKSIATAFRSCYDLSPKCNNGCKNSNTALRFLDLTFSCTPFLCLYIALVIITGFISEPLEVSESDDKGSQVVVTDQKVSVPSDFSSFDSERGTKVLISHSMVVLFVQVNKYLGISIGIA